MELQEMPQNRTGAESVMDKIHVLECPDLNPDKAVHARGVIQHHLILMEAGEDAEKQVAWLADFAPVFSALYPGTGAPGITGDTVGDLIKQWNTKTHEGRLAMLRDIQARLDATYQAQRGVGRSLHA